MVGQLFAWAEEVTVGGDEVVDVQSVGAGDKGIPKCGSARESCFDSCCVQGVQSLDCDWGQVVKKLAKKSRESTLKFLDLSIMLMKDKSVKEGEMSLSKMDCSRVIEERTRRW